MYSMPWVRCAFGNVSTEKSGEQEKSTELNQAVANSRSDVTPRRKRMSAAMKSARKGISPPMESAQLKKERNLFYDKNP